MDTFFGDTAVMHWGNKKRAQREMGDITSLNFSTHKRSFFFSFFLTTGILFALGGMLFSVLFLFRVENIEVKREETDMNLQYEQIVRILDFVKGKNLLILSAPFLEKQLMIKFPELSEVHISKKFPQSLSVSVQTDPIAARWISFIMPKEKSLEENISPEEQKGFLSEQGLFFPNGPENAFLIVEKDVRESPLAFSSQIFPKESVRYLFDIKAQLEGLIGKPLVRAEFLGNAQELHFVTEDEMSIWIFLREDPQAQVEKFAMVLKEENILKTPLEYIDLRISQKVIYRPR